MNHCKDCKHFGDELKSVNYQDGGYVSTGYHKCLYLKHVNMEDDLRFEAEPKNAGVVDDSGYFAALIVRDDFGCVNFEPASSETPNE